jgi:hypothetical protein
MPARPVIKVLLATRLESPVTRRCRDRQRVLTGKPPDDAVVPWSYSPWRRSVRTGVELMERRLAQEK